MQLYAPVQLKKMSPVTCQKNKISKITGTMPFCLDDNSTCTLNQKLMWSIISV